MREARDPQTPLEWQEAVNLAEVFLELDSARQYGLVTGGPDVDVDRCQDLLKRGATDGYVPRELNAVTKRLLREFSERERRVRATRTPEKSEGA